MNDGNLKASNGENRNLFRPELKAAIVSGLIAGLVMSIFSMSVSMRKGLGLWHMPNLISCMWFGPESFNDQFSFKTIIGLLTHMITSMAMGIVAIPFVEGKKRTGMFLSSYAYSLASYPFVFTFVLSWANPLMYNQTDFSMMTIGHSLFGIVLGASFIYFRNRAVGN
jgi:hypothetical protein